MCVCESPRASQVGLVEWYQTECTDQALPDEFARALLLAREIDQLYETSEVTCGFEYHHYRPDSRPDYLVFCNAKRFASEAFTQTVPEWWSKVQRDCIEECCVSSVAPGLYLPCENWIEFDQTNYGLAMAGIWQMVALKKLERLGDWERIVSTLDSWQFCNRCILRSSAVRHFYQMLTYPDQIGLMCGRGPFLKLMKQHSLPAQIDAHIHYLASITNDSWSFDLNSYSAILKEHGMYLSPATSVDIDLDGDFLLSKIGIEIHPNGLLGRALPDIVLSLLSNVFNIDSAQIESIARLLSYLPRGVESRSNLDGKTKSRSRIRVAKLNHLKIVLSPESPAMLKSYVRLVETYS
jgi:hypothetical protein